MDKRVMEVQKPYRKEYAKYLKVNDERAKKELRPLSFDEYLWYIADQDVMANIEANKIKNKYEELFEDLNYDLHRILVLHKFNKKATNLNNLKLKLAATMDKYKNKIYEIDKEEI